MCRSWALPLDRRSRPDTRAECCDIDMVAAPGAAIGLEVAVDRGDRDRRRIGGRIDGFSPRAVIAGRRHLDDVSLGYERDGLFEQQIVWPGEAHIDDRDLARGQEIDGAHEIVGLGDIALAALSLEGVDGDQVGIAEQPRRATVLPSGNESCDRSPVLAAGFRRLFLRQPDDVEPDIL